MGLTLKSVASLAISIELIAVEWRGSGSDPRNVASNLRK